MTLFLAADHAGFKLKEKIRVLLAKQKVAFDDLTPKFKADDDYPLVANKLVQRTTYNVQRGTRYVVRGVLICGSGVGVCIAANRHKGIRAAVGENEKEIKRAREHNDINVLCLSGWDLTTEKALKIINAFLKTKKSSSARHLRRIKQLG
ncbi:MAG: RpiB/LacA/LacB family sugar-phosphate isomerase [Patescibacteria group bacterium]